MIAQLQRAIGDALADIATFVPKLGAFLLILVIGYFVAKALERATEAILERVGFDKWVERGGIKRVLGRSKYDASSLLSRTVYYIVGLFVLQMAFGVFGPNPVSQLLASVVGYLPRLFVAGLIVVIGAAVAAAVRDIVEAAVGGLSYGRIAATAASVAILVITAFAALSQLNIAPLIVTGLFYAILAVVAGSAIIAIGGSGIGPLRTFWESAIARAQSEGPAIREQAQGATERVKQRAEERTRQAKEATPQEQRQTVGVGMGSQGGQQGGQQGGR